MKATAPDDAYPTQRPDPIAKYFRRTSVLIAGISALVFVLIAIRGTILNYSPVPFMDMWTGFLGFYLKVNAGDWGAWWSPHVDHRIVLSRLLFWLDLRFFGGTGWFSLAASYLFIFFVAALFVRIWFEQTGFRRSGDPITGDGTARSAADWCVLFFLIAWIFSWSQSQNLTFPFQSQFILAQLLPLAALFFLHLSAVRPARTTRYYWIAVLFGVLAIGSMANGVLALPFLAFYTIVVRMRFWRATLLAVLSVCALLLYFYHLFPVAPAAGTPGLIGHVLENKAAAIAYVLCYLGSPFTYLLSSYATFDLMANIKPIPEVLWVCEILSLGLISLTVFSFYRSVSGPRQSTLSLVLILFIFYLILGAMVTTVGRLGFQTAYTSRYVTPALYAWAAALLLVWPWLRQRMIYRNCAAGLLGIVFYCLMFPMQTNALADTRATLAEWKMAAMALELQVNDQDQIGYVSPAWLGAPQIALAARAQHLSIFGIKPIKDAYLLMGHSMNAGHATACVGNLESVVTLPNDQGYLRVMGWMFSPKPVRAPAAIYLVNESNHVIGVGLIGLAREDVARAQGKKALYSGFQAYLLSKDKDQTFSVISPTEHCVLQPPA